MLGEGEKPPPGIGENVAPASSGDNIVLGDMNTAAQADTHQHSSIPLALPLQLLSAVQLHLKPGHHVNCLQPRRCNSFAFPDPSFIPETSCSPRDTGQSERRP